MDPATLAIVGLVSSVASAGVGLIGGIQQGQAQKASAEYAAGVARNNQIIAQQNAARSAQAGAVQAQNRDYRTRAQYGAVLAAQGAGGTDTQTGSSKEVRDSVAQLGRYDSQAIMDNAMLQVRAEQAQGTSFGEQATLDTMQARNAGTAGLISGAGSILGGASSFADKWLRYQTTGVPGFSSV